MTFVLHVGQSRQLRSHAMLQRLIEDYPYDDLVVVTDTYSNYDEYRSFLPEGYVLYSYEPLDLEEVIAPLRTAARPMLVMHVSTSFTNPANIVERCREAGIYLVLALDCCPEMSAETRALFDVVYARHDGRRSERERLWTYFFQQKYPSFAEFSAVSELCERNGRWIRLDVRAGAWSLVAEPQK